MASILFLPSENEISPEPGKDLLRTAAEAGIPLTGSCGGRGICGKCRIIVEKAETLLSPPSEMEKDALGGLLAKGYRLACRISLPQGGIIRIPEGTRLRPQVILTSNTDHPYPVRLRSDLDDYYVHVPPSAPHATTADLERILSALKEIHGITPAVSDPCLLRKLPRITGARKKGLSAIVFDEKEIIGLSPGRHGRILGAAFDVGSTTVVGYLLDLASGEKISVKAAVNPQITFGDDVISRLKFCREDPKGLNTLNALILDCLNGLIRGLSQEAGIGPDGILELGIVGNTVMHHILLGVAPGGLAEAPYTPVLQRGQTLKARDLGLEITASGYAHLLPLKAGFVGSDTVACILATNMHRRRIPSLLMDLGTNGEIVFGNRDRLLCCSTAAGPAFEGGHIRWGMRAAPGAIDRVHIDAASLEVSFHTIHERPPRGLCGSGILSAASGMIRAGVITAMGGFREELRHSRIREGREGPEFVVAWAHEAGVEQDIVLSKKDIAELQMARSAVASGACRLIEAFGMDPGEVSRCLLAGAVGNYMDPQDALATDLVPCGHHADIIGVGNAAGYGSCLAILDRYKRREAERIAQKMEYVELSGDARFQELFTANLFFRSARDFKENW